MKTNLDTIYKTDNNLENEGVWFETSPGTKFLVRRFGGANSQKVKAALAKYYKPLAKQIEVGAIDAEKEKELAVKVFVESSLISWENIIVDDKPFPFTQENAINLFLALPELYQIVFQYASNVDNYKVDLGNS